MRDVHILIQEKNSVTQLLLCENEYVIALGHQLCLHTLLLYYNPTVISPAIDLRNHKCIALRDTGSNPAES